MIDRLATPNGATATHCSSLLALENPLPVALRTRQRT